MTDSDWQVGYAKSLAVFLNGQGISETGPYGQPVSDDLFLVLVNAHHEPLDFALSADGLATSWHQVLSTAHRRPPSDSLPAGQPVTVADHSLEVWRAQ